AETRTIASTHFASPMPCGLGADRGVFEDPQSLQCFAGAAPVSENRWALRTLPEKKRETLSGSRMRGMCSSGRCCEPVRVAISEHVIAVRLSVEALSAIAAEKL